MDAAEKKRSPLNSHTEWGALKEVVVGEVHNGYVPDLGEDLSLKLFYWDNVGGDLKALRQEVLDEKTGKISYKLYSPQEFEERLEDVENLVSTFQKLGIVVHRPSALKTIKEVSTPDWQSLNNFSHNVRDTALVVGDEIIETPPMCRNRYFECDLLKPIFVDYFRRGAKWTVAPRPLMLNHSFDLSYVMNEPQPEVPGPAGVGYEMMFDAAQILRFGTDLVFNVSTQNHRLGADWLQRHLGSKYRVHVVEITDNHIDSTMMPLRPGLLFVNPYRIHGKLDRLPPALQKWEVVACYETDDTVYSTDKIMLASTGISANVLPIGEDRVIVNEACPQLVRLLEKHRLTAIPVRLRHSRLYAGAFHCITLDTVRDDAAESFLS